jgi:hypothetical protein
MRTEMAVYVAGSCKFGSFHAQILRRCNTVYTVATGVIY